MHFWSHFFYFLTNSKALNPQKEAAESPLRQERRSSAACKSVGLVCND